MIELLKVVTPIMKILNNSKKFSIMNLVVCLGVDYFP